MGFTGHEMIDEMDLVNMNGRVYRPTFSPAPKGARSPS